MSDIARPQGPEPKPAMKQVSEKAMQDAVAESLEQEGPQDFVIVLAYRSTDGEVEEQFGQLVNDIKALYTFKQDVRVYACVEESAAKVLAQIEKPKEQANG